MDILADVEMDARVDLSESIRRVEKKRIIVDITGGSPVSKRLKEKHEQIVKYVPVCEILEYEPMPPANFPFPPPENALSVLCGAEDGLGVSGSLLGYESDAKSEDPEECDIFPVSEVFRKNPSLARPWETLISDTADIGQAVKASTKVDVCSVSLFEQIHHFITCTFAGRRVSIDDFVQYSLAAAILAVNDRASKKHRITKIIRDLDMGEDACRDDVKGCILDITAALGYKMSNFPRLRPSEFPDQLRNLALSRERGMQQEAA